MTRRREDVIVDRSKLGSLTRIGEGSQAVIYSISGGSALPGVTGSLVYKAYKEEVLAECGYALGAAMPGMILKPDGMCATDQQLLKQYTVWPLALVTEHNRAVGIVMKLIPDAYFFDLKLSGGKAKKKLFDGAQLLVPESKKARRGIPAASSRERMVLFLTTMNAVDLLHRNGLIIGDFSENNLIFSNPEKLPKDKGRMFIPKFMDIDGFRTSNSQPPVKQLNTLGWFVPENVNAARELAHLQGKGATLSLVAAAKARAEVQNAQSDIYKLGLLALRLFHVPSPQDPTKIANVYESQSAVTNISRVVGPKSAKTVIAMTEEHPTNRPTAAEVLGCFR